LTILGRMTPATRIRRRARQAPFFIKESDPASKREILKAALTLFVRHGSSDPTIREIAREAGYTNPAMFKFFKTKDDLALYLFKLCYQGVTDEFHQAIRLDRPFHENLPALLQAYSRIADGDLDALLYVTENTRRFWQSLSPRLRQRSIRYLLKCMFEQGKTEGAVARDANTKLLVTGVVGLLSLFARGLYFREFRGPVKNWAPSLEHMIMNMCGMRRSGMSLLREPASS
jgi:AcrR family transcriptional regulator